MLKVFCAVLKTAPYRLNYSTTLLLLPLWMLDKPTLFYSLNLTLNQLNRLRIRLDRQCSLRMGEA